MMLILRFLLFIRKMALSLATIVFNFITHKETGKIIPNRAIMALTIVAMSTLSLASALYYIRSTDLFTSIRKDCHYKGYSDNKVVKCYKKTTIGPDESSYFSCEENPSYIEAQETCVQ